MAGKEIHEIKFKFAGSGDLVWRKVDKGSVAGSGINKDTPSQEDLVLDKAAMKRMYGELIRETDKKKPVLYHKSSQRKISKKGEHFDKIVHEYSVIGPDGLGLGPGEITTAYKKAIEIIKQNIDDFKGNNDCKGIFLKLKGHSRGGTTANYVFHSLSQEYKDDSKVQIVDVSYDPVPGLIGGTPPEEIYGLKDDDINKGKPAQELEFNQTAKMNKSASVFSLNPGKGIGDLAFSPQKIKGLKVLIFTTEKHHAGLYNLNDTSTEKRGYKYKGRSYSAGDIYKLPPGVYTTDAGHELSRIKFLEEIYENKDFKQSGIFRRQEAIELLSHYLTFKNKQKSNFLYSLDPYDLPLEVKLPGQVGYENQISDKQLGDLGKCCEKFKNNKSFSSFCSAVTGIFGPKHFLTVFISDVYDKVQDAKFKVEEFPEEWYNNEKKAINTKIEQFQVEEIENAIKSGVNKYEMRNKKYPSIGFLYDSIDEYLKKISGVEKRKSTLIAKLGSIYNAIMSNKTTKGFSKDFDKYVRTATQIFGKNSFVKVLLQIQEEFFNLFKENLNEKEKSFILCDKVKILVDKLLQNKEVDETMKMGVKNMLQTMTALKIEEDKNR